MISIESLFAEAITSVYILVAFDSKMSVRIYTIIRSDCDRPLAKQTEISIYNCLSISLYFGAL